MLVAICGIDGSGKTTLINLLKDYFENHRKEDVYITKQPTDFYRRYDRFRQYINREVNIESSIIYELALLSATDKLRHYEMEIRPNMDKIIFCDRYVFSAYAYFLARGIKDINWLTEINKLLPLPDITIYIDVDVQQAYQRILSRDGKYTKKEETDMELLARVRKNFLDQPWGANNNYYIVNGNFRSPIEIHEEIKKIILRRESNYD